ncbi:MAG: hypothetical protein WBL63_09960 [Candidatus Acidiferrum sp.]
MSATSPTLSALLPRGDRSLFVLGSANIYYEITNRRVLIVQESWKRKTHFTYLDHIPEISREGNTSGTLWLGPKLPVIGSRGSAKRSISRFHIGDRVPVLADIDDVDSVYRLILDFREKSRSAPSTS